MSTYISFCKQGGLQVLFDDASSEKHLLHPFCGTLKKIWQQKVYSTWFHSTFGQIVKCFPLLFYLLMPQNADLWALLNIPQYIIAPLKEKVNSLQKCKKVLRMTQAFLHIHILDYIQTEGAYIVKKMFVSLSIQL